MTLSDNHEADKMVTVKVTILLSPVTCVFWTRRQVAGLKSKFYDFLSGNHL